MSSHMIRGRQLSRDTEHRKAMRRNLVQSLFEHGKVRTTLPKAKEVQGMAEKLITLARKGTLTARRRVIAILNDRRLVDEEQEFTGQSVVQKLFTDIAPKFVDRPGGYSRIIKLPEHPHRRRREPGAAAVADGGIGSARDGAAKRGPAAQANGAAATVRGKNHEEGQGRNGRKT